MWCNFQKQWPAKTFKDYLWNAARSYTENDFIHWMGMLRGLPGGGEDAYAWLMRIDTKLWARHKMSSRTKCELLLNNLAASFNALILETRDKPIITMLEGIRRLLMRRFARKQAWMHKYSLRICPRILKKL
ncbi:hypothetical protein Tsubulata_008018, partial [Turnera subulata]